MENRINLRLDIQSSLSFIVFSIVIVATAFFLLTKIQTATQELDRLSNYPQYQMLREELGSETSPSSDKSSGEWKSYRSDAYGYMFRYPSKYSVAVDGGGYVTLRDSRGSSQGLSFSSMRKREHLTVGQFVHNDTLYGTDEALKGQYGSEKALTVNGIATYKFLKQFSTRSDLHYFFLKDKDSGVEASYTYFSTDFQGESGVNPLVKEYDQIISTFKFTR